MRLIGADTLKREFTGNFIDAYPKALVHALIDSVPTIDAVPVVRCKDCLLSDEVVTDEQGNEYLVCLYFKALMNRDDYCSLAGRHKRP